MSGNVVGAEVVRSPLVSEAPPPVSTAQSPFPASLPAQAFQDIPHFQFSPLLTGTTDDLGNPTPPVSGASCGGLPLAQALNLRDVSVLGVRDSLGRPVPVQIRPRMRWGGVGPVESRAPLRWIELCLLPNADGSPGPYTLVTEGQTAASARSASTPGPSQAVHVMPLEAGIQLTVGALEVQWRDGHAPGPTSLRMAGQPLLNPEGIRLTLSDPRGFPLVLADGALRIEDAGPLAATIVWQGQALFDHAATGGARIPLLVRVQFEAFAGVEGLHVTLTVQNPRPALHPGNAWVLGDPGSLYLGELAWKFDWAAEASPAHLSIEAGKELSFQGDMLLEQRSSGRPNWQSPRHVDASGRSTVAQKGYRLSVGGAGPQEGLQAHPVLMGQVGHARWVVAPSQFWERFPQSLGLTLRSGRFQGLHAMLPAWLRDSGQAWRSSPTEPGAQAGRGRPRLFAHEFQGGEQFVARAWWGASLRSSPWRPERWRERVQRVGWKVTPEVGLSAAATFRTDIPFPSQHLTNSTSQAESGPHAQGETPDASQRLETTLQTALYPRGKNVHTLQQVGDVRDAYGWRDFGEVQADHETRCGKDATSDASFISNYNNQYDLVASHWHLCLRTGDAQFCRRARELGRHVADIDVYHTRGDRPVYNGGLFWHTTHDTPVGTSSHRSYPDPSLSRGCTEYQSGGPGLGHLYVEGLVLGALMLGDEEQQRSALELAQFALRRRALDSTESDGRALGNYLRTLVTLCAWTGESRFCRAADGFVLEPLPERRGIPEWHEAFLGEAWGRWLALAQERQRVGLNVPPPSAVARVQRGLEHLCQRIEAATDTLPLDVHLARFADVLVMGAELPDAPLERTKAAIRLWERLAQGYWAAGTYPNAKELALLMGSGGWVRAARSREER